MKSPRIKALTRTTLFSATFVLVGVALLGTTFVGQGEESPPAATLVRPQANSEVDTLQSEWEARWGIQITAIRLSANGNVVDFRYRVTDADKASALGNPKTKPALIDRATGKSLHVPSMPKVGQMRSTGQRLAVGKTYVALFSNLGKVVKPGNKVDIVIGEFRAEDLTVTE